MANNLSQKGFKEVIERVERQISNVHKKEVSPEEAHQNWIRLAKAMKKVQNG